MNTVKVNKVNYKIYTNEKAKQVIAVCRYGGQNVRGVATCSPEDEFNIEFGTKLAIARCEAKAAKLKIQNAARLYMEASVAADRAEKRYAKMKQYYMDAVDHFDETQADLVNIIKEIV